MSVETIDSLYEQAIAKAGENPNALGFMRRVRNSKYYRHPGRNIGGYNSDADRDEIIRARNVLKLAIHVGRW